jgi:hypothetical protein
VRMRVVRPLLLAAMLALAIATPAFADVHGVSNAECARRPAPSGASSEGSQSAPGRPGRPIPETASGGRTEGRANDAPRQGTFCED